ncbi:MAG: glycosyltransferase [Thermoleophilia bacterium]
MHRANGASIVRVAMVNKYYPPHLGGIEHHLRDLAEALAMRGDARVRVLTANESRRRVDEIIRGVEITRLRRLTAPASTPITPGLPFGLHRTQTRDSNTADLLHLHFPYPWGELSWFLARPGIPTVLTYHSDIVRQKALLDLYRPLLRRVLDRVDLVIASSPNMVRHSPFLRGREAKCRVVPFGIDVERFGPHPSTQARAAELRRQYGSPLTLFVGRLIYYKGAEVLLRAMTKTPGRLIIIGRGPLEQDLRDLTADLGLVGRVFFLPPVEAKELAAWYRAADVFCLPSVARSEAFGLVQLEAHASGTPVVSTNLTTGVPYVNQDGITGLVVPPGDPERLARALSRLLDDVELRRRLGHQAEARARRHFTIQRMVDGTMEVYREALQARTAE